MRRLVERYGEDEVQFALRELGGRLRGRPAVEDWEALRPFIEDDAIAWLNGRDPVQERSNYAIATLIAEKHAGHSPGATLQRVIRKLGQERERRFLLNALVKSYSERPHAEFFRTLGALENCSAARLPRARYDLALKRQRHEIGEPDRSSSMHAIEQAVTGHGWPPRLDALAERLGLPLSEYESIEAANENRGSFERP